MRIVVFTLLLVIGMGSDPLWASAEAPGQKGISRQEAAQIAKRSPEDQVLKVEKQDTSNGPVYRVKLLGNNGRVRSVYVDALSGQLLRNHK
ncbi:MAG: hypothetical protein CSA50_08850 [Gammaproteobacteria bacterium]|nr:MAG: hypothetical protein CSA50_08850 [Gammaproteobacteria bacterium]